MFGINRRLFMKGALALSTLAMMPRLLFAREWPKDAFAAETTREVLLSLYGSEQTTVSGEVKLKAPEIAENGAVVPVSLETSLSGVKSVAVVVDNNPRPLAVHFEVSPQAIPTVACRIKMGQTSRVLAIVETDDGLFSTEKEVKVTIGGCGG
jgi:sulfur-oxidizing protein SoxY